MIRYYRIDREPVDIDIDEREHKMLEMCLNYSCDPFGAPNHLLMILVAKLHNHIVVNE